MAELEIVEIMLIIISILLLVYSIYIYFDQKRNIRFASPKSKMVPVISVILVIAGIINYLINGQKLTDLGAAFVLAIFAFTMALARNGIGESGIYFEGVRVSWKQISNLKAEGKDGKVYLSYTRKKAVKTMVLSDTTVEEVNTYIKKLRKIYYFGR